MQAYGTRGLRFALLTLKDRGEAEDVVQEAFVRLWRHALRRGMENVTLPLFFHTITNLCKDRMRHRSRHPEEASDLIETLHAVQSTVDPSEEMAVMEAVASLETTERQCILLYYYMDYSIKETAAALGISQELAKTKLYRARQHLRPLLAPVWKEEMS